MPITATGVPPLRFVLLIVDYELGEYFLDRTNDRRSLVQRHRIADSVGAMIMSGKASGGRVPAAFMQLGWH
jgi:hypothetical protein